MQITLVFLFSMKYQYNVVLTIADSKIICSWVLEQVDVANPNYSTMLVLPNVYFCHLSFICNMTTILYKVISTLYISAYTSQRGTTPLCHWITYIPRPTDIGISCTLCLWYEHGIIRTTGLS